MQAPTRPTEPTRALHLVAPSPLERALTGEAQAAARLASWPVVSATAQAGVVAACVVLFVPMGLAGWHLSRNKVLFFAGALFISLAVGNRDPPIPVHGFSKMGEPRG